MPNAGYCHDCQAYVWLTDAWACPNGHPAARVNAWYDSESGRPLTPPRAQEAPASAPAPQPAVPAGTRDAFLAELRAAFAQYPGYAVEWGSDTDMTISNSVANANLGTVKKKVDYEAVLKAVEAERVVYFWEVLKEKGSGLSFGGLESESYSTVGAKRYGTKKEVVIGAAGVASYEWDYGKTRAIVENVAARHGFTVKVVLKKRSAQW